MSVSDDAAPIVAEIVSKSEEMSLLTQVVAVVATVATIAQMFSGTFTVRKVWQMGTPGEFSPVPFLAATLGSSLWCLYGIQLQDSVIIYTNIAGITLNSLYVLVFYVYTQKRIVMSRQVFILLFGISSVTFYIRSFTQKDADVARNHMGLICTIVSLFSCASPLVTLKQVLRTKSTESLPLPLISSVFVVCILWWIYGVLIGDFYMQLTNFLGGLIALAQLSLFCIYPSSSRHHHDKTYQTLKSVS